MPLDPANAPNWSGTAEPIEGRAAEQDEVNQQPQHEQEPKQGYQGSTRIKNLPDLVHVYSPVSY